MVAIGVVTTIPCLLALIYIGSSTVYNDVISLSVSGLYASYFIPCALLLWRRTTGQIATRSDYDDEDATALPTTSNAVHLNSLTDHSATTHSDGDVVQPLLMWGPWKVPGILGTINNAFACVYIVFVIFWSFWPPTTPATPQNMNYSVLVTGAVIGFSIVYYYVWGKKQYKGPLIEKEVKGFARRRM